MPLNILIVGAGICGPALAFLLHKANPKYRITIIERCQTLRAAGQQIDIKHRGVDVIKRMGVLAAVKSRCVNETGLEVVDGNGKVVAEFGINPADEDRLTLTSEFEIMRGDLVKLFYDASLENVARLEQTDDGAQRLRYEFGKTVDQLEQTDDGVNVTFSDGQTGSYELVIGADGLGSQTRKMAFAGTTQTSPFHSLGAHMAFYSIPRIPGQDSETTARFYSATGGRGIATRTSGRQETQVLLFTMDRSSALGGCRSKPVDEQKAAFANIFKGAGWQTDRLIEGMKTCDDFYMEEAAQIKLERLYNGRVVLLGDAAHAPSPFTGLGTTASLIGAYILAGELATCSDLQSALRAYDQKMKAPIADMQKVPGGPTLGIFFPTSRVGVWLLRNAMWTISKTAWLIERLPARKSPKQSWVLPDYPKLNLGEAD